MRALFSLLWHGLSDLGVGDLFVDGGGLHLLQGTHDAVLLAPVGLNHGVHPVRVKHDVVGCDQQHPTNCTLKRPRRGEQNRGAGEQTEIRRDLYGIFACLQAAEL